MMFPASQLRAEAAANEQKGLSAEHSRCMALLQECMKDVEGCKPKETAENQMWKFFKDVEGCK
jgi:hypothetical protein